MQNVIYDLLIEKCVVPFLLRSLTSRSCSALCGKKQHVDLVARVITRRD